MNTHTQQLACQTPATPRPNFRGNVRPNFRQAFTLIEMLVVIGIVALLVSILVVGGAGWINSAKEKKTNLTLATLDTIVEEYHIEMNRYFTTSPIETQQSNSNKLDYTNKAYWERMSLFLEEVESVGSISNITGGLQNRTWEDKNTADDFPPIKQVFDGWDQPIQIVFKGDDGVALTKTPESFRPWFVSPGEDGDFGFPEMPVDDRDGTPAGDNVFSDSAPTEKYFIEQDEFDFSKP